MTEPHSDSVVDLLAKARQGDEQCREILFERCRDYVALMARTKVESWMRRKVDASDLVQQTMLDAMQGMDRFEGTTEAEWLAWLRQVLSHNLHDFIRRFRTAKRAAGREMQLDAPANDSQGTAPGRELADSIATPSQVLMQHEHELQLAAAIARLSDDHREVIELRNLQRLPFDEVAERMGRSRPATQMLWTRAIKKLEELLRSDAGAAR